MARTPSNMLALGTKAPDFSLVDTVTDIDKGGTGIQFDTPEVLSLVKGSM